MTRSRGLRVQDESPIQRMIGDGVFLVDAKRPTLDRCCLVGFSTPGEVLLQEFRQDGKS